MLWNNPISATTQTQTICIYYTLPAESPVRGGNGALLHVEKSNRDIVFPQVKHNVFKLIVNKDSLATFSILFHQVALANDCWAWLLVCHEIHSLRCLLLELLIDRTKISVLNVQRHVPNVKNECVNGSGTCWYSESWNLKANAKAEGAMECVQANVWETGPKKLVEVIESSK